VACWVVSAIRVLVIVKDFLLINSDGSDLLFLKFIRVILSAVDHHQAFVFVEPYLGWDQKYFWKEILPF
jgi:hypothetical protein